MTQPITIVVEGVTDAAVLKRVLRWIGLETGMEYVKNGKDALDRDLGAYNAAARFSPWLVLRDLNGDARCAPELRQRLLPRPSSGMRLQIAVQAVEAWLMADAESLGRFLSIPVAAVPHQPDALDLPRLVLLRLARRSRTRAIREAMAPAAGSTASVGPGYATTLIEFAADRWRPGEAEKRSPSLRHLVRYLRSVRRTIG